MKISSYIVCAVALLLVLSCNAGHTGGKSGERQLSDAASPLDGLPKAATPHKDDATDDTDSTEDDTDDETEDETCNNECVCDTDPVIKNCSTWKPKSDLKNVCSDKMVQRTRTCDKVTECKLPDNPCADLECEAKTEPMQEVGNPIKGTKSCGNDKINDGDGNDCMGIGDDGVVRADESIQC